MRKRGLQAVLLSSLFTIVFAGGALAHRVAPDEDNPALDYLRDENRQDLALGVAEYCAGQSIPLSICAQRLGKDLRAAEAATECADEVGWSSAVDPAIAHGVVTGVDANGKAEMRYHDYYVNDTKQGFGMHRHDWGEAARETAAYQKAAELVEFLKQSFSGKTTTTEAGAKGHIDVTSEGGVDTGVAKAKTGVTAGGSGEYSQKQTEVGPSKEEIQKAWDRGYALGKSQPWATSVVPDIMCTKDKNGAASCNGGPDPTLALISSPTPQTCDCKCPPDLSEPVSMNPTIDPAKSTIEGANDKVASPLESCFQERLEKKRTDLYSDYAETTTEQKTLRKKAEEALKSGICTPEWFGEDFCRDFDNLKAIKVTTADTPPPVPEMTKAEKTALTVEMDQPSQEEIDRRQEAERLARCKDPALTEVERRLYDCANAVDPWCNDLRATFEEKQQLGCPGFESGLLDVPSAEECRRMSALERVEHGCPDEGNTAGSAAWGGSWMLDPDLCAGSSDACPSSNEDTTYSYDSSSPW